MSEASKHAERQVWLRERFFAGEDGLHPDEGLGGNAGETTAWLTKHLASTPGTCSLGEAVAGISALRKLHVELDHAVLTA